jgi:oligopeptidase B
MTRTHFDLSSPLPPPVEKRPKATEIHGTVLVDNYAWLRSDNWQEVLRDPKVLPQEIRDVLERENAYAAATLKPTDALQKTLIKEMRGRIKEDDSDVPMVDGPFEYYERYREGGEHELVCRRPKAGGAEQILLDGDALGDGKPFFDLGDASVSPDHGRLAWSVDDKGSELYAFRIRDLASGEDLPDLVEDTEGSAVWNADSTAFFYVRRDENHRPTRVFRHVIGTPAERDELVFEEKDPGWFVHIHRSRCRRFAIIHVSDHDSAEAHLLDLADPQAKPRLVAARERGLRYDVFPHADRIFIRTNADDAEDFKIVDAPLDAPQRANWRDVVPHRQGCMIVRLNLFAGYLIRQEREDSLPRIVVRDLASAAEHDIAFSEEAYTLGLAGVLEYETTVMRFSYSSMTTPTEIYDYDMAARTRVLRKRQEVPSGHDATAYVTRRVFAPSHDGELVPVSLLYRKGTKLDGSAPLFLTGYGAYGSSYPSSFSTDRFSLVDRGFVFAIAHIRGGTDKGWRWYTQGKLENKPNTFRDFIAAGRYLAQNGFTTTGRIVASGGSAGGMLMGAVANMAPDLFAGIIADVPFVDVMNTMMDETLPLTPPEWLEWGNPITDAKAFATMLSYSPYENVRAQVYPAIFALGGLTDPRVTYWEPAKWVARLRATMTGGGPILFRTNMDAGHGGASGRFDSLKETALQFAFALAATDTQQEPVA